MPCCRKIVKSEIRKENLNEKRKNELEGVIAQALLLVLLGKLRLSNKEFQTSSQHVFVVHVGYVHKSYVNASVIMLYN